MKTKLLVAACASALNQSEEWLVIIPEGNFKGIDGRPFEADSWFLMPERGRQIVTALNSRSINMVIDYEHGTLKAQESGQPAPAAGWLQKFEYIDGIGICSSTYKWTAKAQAFIDAEEYLYLSPVFSYTPTGEVTGLLCVALTNTPNLDELPALLAAAAQDLFTQNDEDLSMNEFLKLMLAKLSLAENATEQEVLTAANSFFATFDSAFGTTLAQAQTLTEAASIAIAARTAANSQQPDLSQYVPIAVVTSLQSEIANLKGAAQTNEIETLITAACSDGRLLGDGMKDWATNLGKDNPQALKDFLNKAPKIPALQSKQTESIAANKQQPTSHSAEALAVAAMFGQDLD